MEQDIEAKKIMLSGIQDTGYPVREVIKDILFNLMQLHDTSDANECYLQTAVQYILAYVGLGFGYLEHKDLFDAILEKAHLPLEQIKDLQKQNPSVILSRSRIRDIIGRWPASPYNSHSITSAIDEIIHHVKNHDLGIYQFYTAKKDGSITALYRLTVFQDYAVFHDVVQNKYYHLLEKGD